MSSGAAWAAATVSAVNCADRAETLGDGSRYNSDRAYDGGNSYGYVGGDEDCPNFFLGRPFVFDERPNNEMDLHDCVRMGAEAYVFEEADGWYELTIHLISHNRHGKNDEFLDILVEDELIFEDVDHVAEAGMGRPFDLRRLIYVDDGAVTIEFFDTRGNHELSAIGLRAGRQDVTPPDAPTGVEALDTYRGVLLKWDRDDSSDFMEVRVIRRTDSAWEAVAVRRTPMAVVPATEPAEYGLVAVDVYENVSDTIFVGELSPRPGEASPFPLYEIFLEPEAVNDLNYMLCEGDLPMCDVDVPGTLIFDGELFEDVRVGYRGSAQLRAPKKSYNIRLDGGDRIRNAKRLALKATFIDPTLLREWKASSYLSNQGAPVSDTFPVRVELNGEYMGVYMFVERVGEDFAANRGWDTSGGFYRGWTDLGTHSTFFSYLEDWENVGANDRFRGDIIDFVTKFNRLPDEDILGYLEENLDVESFLSIYAHYVWTANEDWTDDDFFLHHNPGGKWHYIPWDLHESWSNTRSGISFGQDNNLVDRVLDIPSLRRRYTEKLRGYLEGHLSTEAVLADLDASEAEMFEDMIRDVHKEPREFVDEYLDGLDDLHDFVPARVSYLQGQLGGYEPDESVLVHISELVPGPGGIVAVELRNLAPRPFDVGDYFLTNDPDQPLRWPAGPGEIPPSGRWVVELDEPAELGRQIGLVVRDGGGELVEAVTIPEEIPAGHGYGRYPEVSDRWRVLDVPSPGEPNPWTSPVVIELDMLDPVDVPGADRRVQFSVTNTGDWPVSGGLRFDVTTTQNLPYFGNPRADLPMQLAPGQRKQVDYTGPINVPDSEAYIMRATFHDGEDDWLSATHEFMVTGDPGWPIVINEIMSRNDSTLADEYGEYDDWVEIYNASDTARDLSGLYLTDDDLREPLKWAFPAMELGPRESMIVWCDSDPEQGEFHADFKLDGDGDELNVMHLLDGDPVRRDYYEFGEVGDDRSLGRYPDGNAAWFIGDKPSPGKANIYTPH